MNKHHLITIMNRIDKMLHFVVVFAFMAALGIFVGLLVYSAYMELTYDECLDCWSMPKKFAIPLIGALLLVSFAGLWHVFRDSMYEFINRDKDKEQRP